MFRLFGNWNTYLIVDIRNGKHLDKAQKTDFNEFFEKCTFKRLSQWTILFVKDDIVYWGKANQEKVDKYCYFKTSKSNIENNFIEVDKSKKKSVLNKLSDYIANHLNLMDGCRYSINSSLFHSVEIAEDTNFNISVNVELTATPTSLNPETKVEKRCFELVLNPHDFALLKIN
jgi:hypothetical protein